MLAALSAVAMLGVVDPPPRIERVRPSVFARGTGTELDLGGLHLVPGTRAVVDGGGGVTAVVLAAGGKSLRLRVQVASGAALGDHELRVITPGGVSNARRIRVTELRVALDDHSGRDAPNDHSGRDAPRLALPAYLDGQVLRAAEVDRFRFTGEAGRTLVFDVEAARIGSALEPRMVVRDREGRLVGWSRLEPHGDPMLAFTPQQSGDYTLEVHDRRYRGGAQYFYRVRAGCLPYVASVFPPVVARGTSARVTLLGENLGADLGRSAALEIDAAAIDAAAIDAAAIDAAGGRRLPFRVSFAHGISNEVALALADGPQLIEQESNGTLAMPIEVGAEVCGRVDSSADADTYRLTVREKRALRIEVEARRLGSPLDALLLIRDEHGARIAADDDGLRPDALARRTFEPGTYVLEVQDVTGRGSPRHAYRLRVRDEARERREFAVHFLPDTAVVGRGGHARLWCEAQRSGGFDGTIEIHARRLPPGVTCAPVVLGPDNGWTSLVVLAASEDAPLGSGSIMLEARAGAGAQACVRDAVAEADRREVVAGWATVVDRLPFGVAPLSAQPRADAARWAAEQRELERALREPSPELVRERREWVERLRGDELWITPESAQIRAGQSRFERLDDGSFLAVGPVPDADAYTITAEVDLEQVAALRLDALPHDSLPHGGPGRHDRNGNFVLNTLRARAAPRGGGEPVDIELRNAEARYSQPGYEVARAIDGDPSSGWAMTPQNGQANWAVFDLAGAPRFQGGTKLTVVVEQRFGTGHLIGRLRLSVASRRTAATVDPVPEGAVRLARAAPRDATAPLAGELLRVVESVSPRLAAMRARIEEIAAGRGPQREIDAIERQLATPTAALAESQARWEDTTRAVLTRWEPLLFEALDSDRGARFEQQRDHSIDVRAALAPKDNYALVARSALPQITALRLEALPSVALPSGGPGLAPNGNFVLTDVSVTSWPAGKPEQAVPVVFEHPEASYAQPGFPIAGTLDGDHSTGWAVGGTAGKPSVALWRARGAGTARSPTGTELRIVLEHQSPHVDHLLGRFRLSVTAAKDPRLYERGLPLDVVDVLATASEQRSDAAARRLASYYRRHVAPELAAARARLTELHAQMAAFPPVVVRGNKTTLAVAVTRRAGFDSPIEVALEGFASGRDERGNPRAIGTSIAVAPVTIAPDERIALLELAALRTAELGARSVVLRATARRDGSDIVAYSEAFPLEVRDSR